MPKSIESGQDAIEALLEVHGRNPESILEILQGAQAQKGNLTQETVAGIAKALKVPARQVYGIASFYSMLNLGKSRDNIVRVCDGPACWLKNANKVKDILQDKIQGQNGWTVEASSCLGLCDRAPAALVNDEQAGPLTMEHIGQLIHDYRGYPRDYSSPKDGELRVMLSKAGIVDPDSFDSAITHGAYQALGKAMQRPPDEVIAEVESSGLTGRGGAGFPVGRKWRFVAQAPRNPKFIICNADESEPLIFKDRVLIDSNPHQILEGMAIAAYATGADQAYIYIRGEYEYQARRLEKAIQEAGERNWLGEHIQGSDFSFHIHVHRGAGAYICGEETALIESLEGKRGEPRLRPPYPPTAGYHGLPTLVNNVESYAAVPAILMNGAPWYRSLSAHKTPGTKIYMILGHVNQPGLFEAPFGITLRQAIEQFGGGMLPGSEFKFALTGGAAGLIASASHLDIPIDYGSSSLGVSMGAGAFLVCDQTVSPVEFSRELLRFFAYESCGKCTPCRVGTHQAYLILSDLANGKGSPGDVQELHSLAEYMGESSFCGLGQSVPLPLKSVLTHFASDFIRGENVAHNRLERQ